MGTISVSHTLRHAVGALPGDARFKTGADRHGRDEVQQGCHRHQAAVGQTVHMLRENHEAPGRGGHPGHERGEPDVEEEVQEHNGSEQPPEKHLGLVR